MAEDFSATQLARGNWEALATLGRVDVSSIQASPLTHARALGAQPPASNNEHALVASLLSFVSNHVSNLRLVHRSGGETEFYSSSQAHTPGAISRAPGADETICAKAASAASASAASAAALPPAPPPPTAACMPTMA